MIKIEHLSKSFESRLILNDIQWNIDNNSIHGLIGVNGAGKTTLFNCINNFESYNGSIKILDIKTIGYLPAQLFFYAKMKGIEYIEFCLIARKIKPNREQIANFNVIFELPLHKYACEYSTGMKKKLALMAIFLQKNDCLILDEPFNGLDISACILLKKLLQKERVLTIISSHIISSLTDLCDAISMLVNGEIKHTYLSDEFRNLENDLIELSLSDKIDYINSHII